MTGHRWPSLLFAALLASAPGTLLAETRNEAPGGVIADRITSRTITVYNHDPEEIRKRLAQQLDRFEGDRRAAEAKAAELARATRPDQDVTTQTVIGFLRVLGRRAGAETRSGAGEDGGNYGELFCRCRSALLIFPRKIRSPPILLGGPRRRPKKGGNFEEADRLLEQAEVRELAAVDEHLTKGGPTSRRPRRQRGNQAAAGGEAAAHYEQAARDTAAERVGDEGLVPL